MVRPSDYDYTYIEKSLLYIKDKDGLLCFLKDYLSGLKPDVLESVLDYVGAPDDIWDETGRLDLNMAGFEDLLSAYMCLDIDEPTGEFSSKPRYESYGLRLIIEGRDIYDPFVKWKDISGYLTGWIQWQDTYDNHSFRYVFMFGTMTEEHPVFASDGIFNEQWKRAKA